MQTGDGGLDIRQSHRGEKRGLALVVLFAVGNFSKEQIAEIDILVRYNLETTQQGIKVHSNAGKEHVDAVERLFEKGLVTHIDGGYLTDLGRSAAEHAQALILMLAPQSTAS